MNESMKKVCKCGNIMNVWTDEVVVNASQKNNKNTYTCKCPECGHKSDVDVPIQDQRKSR